MVAFLDYSGLSRLVTNLKSYFVAQVAGKGLSTEDYTTIEKSKLASIASSAQVNTLETIKVNGVSLSPDADKAVDIEVPTKTSDLENDSDFATQQEAIMYTLIL